MKPALWRRTIFGLVVVAVIALSLVRWAMRPTPDPEPGEPGYIYRDGPGSVDGNASRSTESPSK
jgi:hypothetical protein